MEFGYHAVPAVLAHAVKAVWFANGTKAEFEHSDPIVPDGCVEMVFNLGDAFREAGSDAVQPRDLLVGQMTRPTICMPTGDVDLIGIRFWSGRAGAVLRTPMWELQDHMARVSDVLAGADTWTDEMRDLPTTDRVTVLSSRLAGRCHLVDPERLRIVDGALTTITRRRGNVSIEHVAREAGVSRRHLERQFRDQVGLGAKQVARIARVHAALRVIDTEPSAGGVDIALRCGFADQAHLIKECRAIAGVTPARVPPSGSTLSSMMREA